MSTSVKHQKAAFSRSEMPTPVGDHSEDPQVAAFLAMVETEAKLRATIAELRAECARLDQMVAEGDREHCAAQNRIGILSLQKATLAIENADLKKELCSRDTATDIVIEGDDA